MPLPVAAPNPVPLAARVALLRQAAVEAVTADDIGAVVKKLIDLAKEGDLRAARLVLHYTLGKPGSALPDDFAPPHAPQQHDRHAPNTPPLNLKRESLSDGLSLNELITRQLQEGRAADTKRVKPAERKPMSASPSHTCARTDAMCLVNVPDGKRS